MGDVNANSCILKTTEKSSVLTKTKPTFLYLMKLIKELDILRISHFLNLKTLLNFYRPLNTYLEVSESYGQIGRVRNGWTDLKSNKSKIRQMLFYKC